MKRKLFYFIFLFAAKTVFGQPVISSFAPASGPIGTTVTINGNNFSTVPSNNIVFFGAVQAGVNSASATSLTVTVPSGTTYQPITITTAGLTGYSNIPFVTTFPSGNLFNENSFGSPKPFPVASTPFGICIVDLDQDGKPEVAVTNIGSNNFSVLRNTSIGDSIIFAAKIDFTTGIYPYFIICGDFDGDGKQDLIISNQTDATISIFKNTGTPGNIVFSNRIDLPVGNSPSSICAGDIDKDGKADIIVANTGSNSISVMRNTTVAGVISFAPRIDYTLLKPPTSITLGDFDGDSKLDIAAVLANTDRVFYIIPNNSTSGTISLGSIQNITTSVGLNTTYNSIKTGDFDNDGKLDISVTGRPLFYENNVFRNQSSPGNYNFVLNPITGLSYYYGLDNGIGDLNGDGKIDISLLYDGVGDVFGAARNLTASSSITMEDYHYSPVTEYNSFYKQIAIGDLNGDGKPESIRSSPAKNVITVVKNKFLPGPHIISFSPTTATTGDTVIITGTDLNNINNVSFGLTDAISVILVSSTSIKAVVGSGSTGNVFIANINGTDFLPGFIFSPPMPTIASIDPTYGYFSSGVNIYGTNLSQINTVKFGGVTARSFTILNPTHIVAFVDTGASGSVSVTNSNGTGSIGGFTFYTMPTIFSFSPSSATTGDTITIQGVHFSGVQYVRLGNVDVSWFAIISDTIIKAVVSTGATGFVYVANVAGNYVLPGFSFLPPPIISSFTPTSAAKGDMVTINGQFFSNTISVTFGGVPADSFRIISPGIINAYPGIGASGDIILQTIISSDTISGFTFIPAPIVSSFTPTSAKTGDIVTINGNNFTPVSTVSFGNVPASSYTYISPTILNAVVGTGASGAVKVTTIGGADSLAGFTYLIPPVITFFTPSSGDSGTIVTIKGIHFNGTTAVSFGGTPAISYAVIADTTINAVVGNGTTGSISVVTAQGISALGTFTVLPYLSSVDLNICPGANTTITSNFPGTVYQWQLDTGNGTFINISNNANYNGTNTSTLQLTAMPSAWYGYKYRCFINSSYYSRQTVIKFSNTWTGAASNAWENPANWSCGTVPDFNTDVIINSGTVIVSSNVVIRSLTLNPGVSYTVTSPNIITILGANSAMGNLGGAPTNCTPFVINGLYNQEVPLDITNTIQIQVNVTATGPYGITTNTVGGINFYATGNFTSTGLKNVILKGNGVPGLAGNQNFVVSFGGNTCGFTINIISAPLNYIPTTLNSNWSYNATSTPDPLDSLYKISLPNFLQFNGQTFREFSEVNEFGLDHNAGYRKNGNNYYFHYNAFEDLHSLQFLRANGEIKQLDENAPAGGTWTSDITGWVNGGSTNTPVRVQGMILEKAVPVTLITGLSFSNVTKVKLNFYDMTIPASPTFVYSEERWFAFGVGLIYFKSTDPFGTGIIYQLKRYQIN